MIAKPAARISVLILVGVTIIYVIGLWEGRLSAGEREHQERVAQILKLGKAFRGAQDSLRALGDSLAAVDSAFAEAETRAANLLGRLARANRRERDSLAFTSLDSLLPSLRLRPIRIDAGAVRFATDSAGVRFLADRMLRLVQAERQVDVLGDLASARAGRIAALDGQLATALLRATRAATRLPALERLLAESDRRRRRKGKFLGFLPKPPPLVIFLAGAVVCKFICPAG